MMNLQTGKIDTLPAVNSDKSDTYHSWSSNSHWFVFASKRDDGLYGKPYFSYVDSTGKAYKPFVLPQEDPEHYDITLKSYNIPELSTSELLSTLKMYKRSTTTRKLRLLNNRIMENTRKYRYIRGIASLLFGCAICLFWGLYYPHHLQLPRAIPTLFYSRRNIESDKCLHPGGIAEYIAEFPERSSIISLGQGLRSWRSLSCLSNGK